MDSQQLSAFLAVASQQSFSLAAESLFITQSAVSKRISLLEQQLGTPLFDRHNRSVSLTEAGRQLLPKAKRILELMSDTELELANLSGKVHGTLSLATSHHIGLHRLPPVLKAFVLQFPDAQLNLEFRESERAYLLVKQRQVELALSTLDNLPSPELSQYPLWTDAMQCVCAKHHPLTKISRLSLADLANTTAVLPEKNTITYQLVEEQFQTHGLTLNAPMPTNYLETIKMMVSVGLGWSVLPTSMIDDQITRLQWPGAPMYRELGVIHLKHRTLSNGAQEFLKLLKTLAAFDQE